MNKNYSPYSLLGEAEKLISECSAKGTLTSDCEKQIVALLNTAELYPNMSTYQLSIAHRNLADLYNSLGISGTAIAHYEIALEMNPKIAVKRKLKQLKSLPIDELSYSLDAHIVLEPDYSNIAVKNKVVLTDETLEEQNKKNAESLGISLEDYKKLCTDTLNKIKNDKLEAGKIYDPEFEAMLEERLSKLDEESRYAFYQIRSNRDDEVILTNKELDLLTLKSLENSFNYRKEKIESDGSKL